MDHKYCIEYDGINGAEFANTDRLIINGVPYTERTNEYNRGWYEAIEKVLKECYYVYIEGVRYRVIQEETLTKLGISVSDRDICHIFDNVTQEEFEKIAKEIATWDTKNIIGV